MDHHFGQPLFTDRESLGKAGKGGRGGGGGGWSCNGRESSHRLILRLRNFKIMFIKIQSSPTHWLNNNNNNNNNNN